MRQARSLAAVREQWAMDVDLGAICLTPEEFAGKASQISTISEALKEGQELWEH